MALIVLGAGATRGASFVGHGATDSICLPPMDADFFTQLQRIESAKHSDTVDHAIEDAVRLFGNNFSVTLENMFTVIEHTLRMVKATGATSTHAEFNRQRLEAMRTNLLQAIAAVLEESLADGRESRKCDYHSALVKALKPKDAIVALNYDCLIDHTLKANGNGIWNARSGYRLPLPRGRHGTIGEKHWNPQETADKNRTIRLLKLHGSLNFSRRSEKLFVLKERPYTKQKGALRFEIIPPEWHKRFDEGVFGALWTHARREIHAADTIVSIGYSFPVTDLHTSALFRVSVRPERLKTVVVVNPDADARRRTLDVLRRGLSRSTRVLVFDLFREFAAVKRSLWER